MIKYKYKVCILQRIKHLGIGLGIILFNATFNNISVKSRRSVLLVEETRELGENHRPVTDTHQILERKPPTCH